MENTKISKVTQNHIIHIENRKRLDITGVSNVATFNETNVVLYTSLGVLQLKGRGLKVNKLNVDNGDMSIEGEIISMVYSTDSAKNKKSFLEKLLK